MNVAELREILKDLPGDRVVVLKDPDTGWLMAIEVDPASTSGDSYCRDLAAQGLHVKIYGGYSQTGHVRQDGTWEGSAP